jgi:hypothetical protein
MTRCVTTIEVHAWIEENLSARTDLGFRKAIANLVLEPPSPFEPDARGRPKTGFLLLVCLVTAAIAFFLYFNFVS